MFGAKPLASLSSGLLARKGQARPAMRSQAMAGFTGPAAVDDLGWNDMGQEAAAAALPPVLAQREALKEEVEQPAPAEAAPEPLHDETSPEPPTPEQATPEPEPAPVLTSEVVDRISRDAAQGGKAAFTLRLPPERHLRLRLASAVRHRSAQAIVTEALDVFLAGLPEVDELARQCAASNRGNP